MSTDRPALRRLAAALLAAGALSLSIAYAPAARAADDDEGQSVEKKVRAQMEKILELMRSSEKQLLEASRTGGKKPEGPEVKPPEPSSRTSGTPPEGAPPPSPDSSRAGGESDG